VSHFRILRGVAKEYRARRLCHLAAPEREVFSWPPAAAA
jgi:hypothetical protein